MARKTQRRKIITVGDAEYGVSDLCRHVALAVQATKPVRYQARPGGGIFKAGNKTVAIHKGGLILGTSGQKRLELPDPLARRRDTYADAKGPTGMEDPRRNVKATAGRVHTDAMADTVYSQTSNSERVYGEELEYDEDMAFESDPVATIEFMIHQREYEKALVYMNKRLVQAPHDAQIMVMKAEVLMMMDDYEGAHKLTDKILETAPNDEMAVMIKHDVFESEDRHEEALEFIGKKYQNNPGNINMEYDWISSLRKTGRHEEALGHVSHQLALSDDEIYKQTTKDKTLLELLAHQFQTEPNAWIRGHRRNMYKYKALILKEMGRHDEALDDINRAIEINRSEDSYKHESKNEPTGPAILPGHCTDREAMLAIQNMLLRTKIDILSDADRHDESLACCAEMSALFDPRKRSYNIRGLILLRAGRLEEAIEAFDIALDSNPDDEEVLLNMFNALVGLSRTHDAREIVSRVLENNPYSKKAKLAMDRLS